MTVVGEKESEVDKKRGSLSEIAEAWDCIASDMPFWVVCGLLFGPVQNTVPLVIASVAILRITPSKWFVWITSSRTMATIVEASDITRHEMLSINSSSISL